MTREEFKQARAAGVKWFEVDGWTIKVECILFYDDDKALIEYQGVRDVILQSRLKPICDKPDVVCEQPKTIDEVDPIKHEPKPDAITANMRKVLDIAAKIGAQLSQTAKADAGKPRLSLVPTQILYDIAQVREYGNSKYGDPENWRTVEMQRYVDAAYRHWLEFIKDPNSKDAESGIEHYKHVACNMAFICELIDEQGFKEQSWRCD